MGEDAKLQRQDKGSEHNNRQQESVFLYIMDPTAPPNAAAPPVNHQQTPTVCLPICTFSSLSFYSQTCSFLHFIIAPHTQDRRLCLLYGEPTYQIDIPPSR